MEAAEFERNLDRKRSVYGERIETRKKLMSWYASVANVVVGTRRSTRRV